MFRQFEKGIADVRMICELLGPADQPEVEIVFERPDVGRQFRVKNLGIVDEIAGMDFEELGERHPRGVRQMWPRAALDLREVGLADRDAHLALDRIRERLLGHFAVEATESALDIAEEAELFAESHNKSQYTNCNLQYDLSSAVSKQFRIDWGWARPPPAARCPPKRPRRSPPTAPSTSGGIRGGPGCI